MVLAAERRSRLVDLVRTSGVVSTEDLAAALTVSAETIRRDLLALEKRGALTRVHGGATTRADVAVASESSFDVRSEEQLQRKQSIARFAAGLVPTGSLIFLDVGTTALLAARALPLSLSATVVTTSLRAAVELADRPGIDVIVAGGRVRSGDLALSGLSTAALVSELHFDVALLGSGGLHADAGLTDYHHEEAQTRNTVISNSARSFVLCDATKFGKVARYRVAALSDFTGVIVDEAPTAELATALRVAGTQVIGAD